MILYFSGTGNSKYVAEKIAASTEEKVISLNEIIKNNKNMNLHSEEPYVFVLPVYAGRMPKVVEQCIMKMKLEGSKKVYFIMTCFKTPYSSEKYIQKLCDKKHLDLLGFDYVNMPQSYIAMYDVPNHNQAVNIYKNAMPRINEISEKIKMQTEFDRACSGAMMSTFINPLFYPMMVSAKGFHTNDKCIGCGKCQELCPLNNITISGKKPVWGNNCTHCMACINGCSNQAIEFKNATMKKTRNYNIGSQL